MTDEKIAIARMMEEKDEEREMKRKI